MAWYDPNSFYHNQSAQNVADFFSPEWNVSSICWDDFRDNTVEDYDDEDITSGYVRSSVWDDDTQIFVSYPKFLSAAGTYI